MNELISSQQMEEKVQNTLENGYRLTFKETLAEARQLLQPNYGFFIGASFIYLIALIILSFIPFVNILVSIVSNGFLFGGFMWLCYLIECNQEVSVGRFFDVRKRLLDLMGLALIQFMSFIVALIPLFLFIGAEIMQAIDFQTMQPDPEKVLILIKNPMLYVGYFIAIIGFFLLYVFYSLSYGFVIIGNYNAVDAVKSNFVVVKNNLKDHVILHLAFWGITVLVFAGATLVGSLGLVLHLAGGGLIFGLILFCVYMGLIFYVMPLYLVFQYRIFSKILNLNESMIDDIDTIGSN